MLDEKEFNLIFAKNLSQYMSFYGLKQIDLAKRLKVSTSTINSWVHAQRTPRMDKVDILCKLFRCKRSDLIAEEFHAPTIMESDLLEVFRDLNDEGQEEALKLVKMLRSTGQYTKDRVDEVVENGA